MRRRSLLFSRWFSFEHAKLDLEALSNLDAWRGAAKPFYVCPVCGYTTSTPADLRTWSECGTPNVHFVAVA
jgi:hypothetical protein